MRMERVQSAVDAPGELPSRAVRAGPRPTRLLHDTARSWCRAIWRGDRPRVEGRGDYRWASGRLTHREGPDQGHADAQDRAREGGHAARGEFQTKDAGPSGLDVAESPRSRPY